jgi:hypothetical protein
MAKLLKEQCDCDILIEAAIGNVPRKYYIQGPWIQQEIVNKNRRKYPGQHVEPEIRRYIQEEITGGRALGEFGHPDIPAIHPPNVSHKIISLEQNGNDWIGKAVILDTTQGKNAKAWIDEGVQIGVSTRALGSLINKEGINIVQPDFRLVTAGDIVVTPSAPGAVMTAIMEQRELLWDDSGVREVVLENARNSVSKARSGRSLEEARIAAIEAVISELNKSKVKR